MIITEAKFTWAPCDFFMWNCVQQRAEELTDSPATLNSYPDHHLEPALNPGGFTRRHLVRGNREERVSENCVLHVKCVLVYSLLDNSETKEY